MKELQRLVQQLKPIEVVQDPESESESEDHDEDLKVVAAVEEEAKVEEADAALVDELADSAPIPEEQASDKGDA